MILPAEPCKSAASKTTVFEMAHNVTLAARHDDLADDAIETLMRHVFEKTLKKLIHDLDTDLPTAPAIHRSADRERACEPRGLMASGMLEEYRRINAASLARKSPQQLWKWCVARQSNLDIFLHAIGGDCPFHALEIKHTHTGSMTIGRTGF